MVKSQRTKGNVKPSSSGRVAQLLATTSGASSVMPLISFSSVKDTSLDGQQQAIKDEQELELDGDIRLLIKKMVKKDNITKVKALQEFCQICKDKEEDSVRKVLQFWPKLYNKLAIEYDWRVREATHKAHEQVVTRVGRNIAPHLKQLMPVWIMSMFDPYAPSASAAKSSFDAAFPLVKQPDVINFTKEQVVNYMLDVLLNQTLQTIGDLNLATQEEIQAKYDRLIATSLQVLSFLLTSIAKEQLTEIESQLNQLLSDAKFWKFAKSKDSLIRSCWYNLISCLSQSIPKLINLHATKACTSTLIALDESCPLVASSVWQSALAVLISIEDCWKHVNFKKAFSPSLKHMLREGGKGNASTIFPYLVPMLSRIPNEVLFDSALSPLSFYKDIFVSIRMGITKTSMSECNAIIRAYFECFQYCIKKSEQLFSDNSNQFLDFLVNDELSLLLNDSISCDCKFSNSSVFVEVRNTLKFLKNTDNNNSNVLENIIKLLRSICLDAIKDPNSKKVSQISCLISSIGFESKEGERKDGRKIRFRRDDDEVTGMRALKLETTTSEVIKYEEMQSFIIELTAIAFDSLSSSQENLFLLDTILNFIKLNSIQTLSIILKCDENECLNKFWNSYLKQWLTFQTQLSDKNKSKKEMNDEVNLLIDISLTCALFANNQDQVNQLLNNIVSIENCLIFERLVSRIHDCNKDKLNKWLKTDSFGVTIIKIAETLIDKSSTDSTQEDILWKIINHCFTLHHINSKYIEDVIEKFRVAIECRSENDSANLENLTRFTCKLACELFSSYELVTSSQSSKGLLLILFSLNCQLSSPNNQLHDAWTKGVEMTVKSNGGFMNDESIVTQLASKVRSFMQVGLKSIENAKVVANCAFDLLQTVHLSNCDKSSEEEVVPISLSNPNIVCMLDLMLLSNSEWIQLENKCSKVEVHKSWLNGEMIWDVNDCKLDVTKEKNITNDDEFLFTAFATSLFIEKLLENQNLISLSNPECDQQFNSILISQLKHLFVARALCSRRHSSQQLSDFHAYLEKIMNCIEADLRQLIANNLIELSSLNGPLYAMALNYFLTCHVTSIQFNPSTTYNDVVTFQQCFSHLDDSLLKQILTDSLNAFICADDLNDFSNSIGYLAIINSCLRCDKVVVDFNETVLPIMDLLSAIKATSNELYFYERPFEQTLEFQLCHLIIDTFSIVVHKWSHLLSQTQWDLILCSLTSWVMNMSKHKHVLFKSLSSLIFSIKSNELLHVVAQVFEKLQSKAVNPNNYPPNLLEEWIEFHSKNIYGIIIPNFFETCEKDTFGLHKEALVKSLAKSIQFLPASFYNDLLDVLPAKDALPMESSLEKTYETFILPSNKENILNNFSHLLVKKIPGLTVAVHSFILKSMDFIFSDVLQADYSKEGEDDEEILLSPPKSLLSLLQLTDNLVCTTLSEFSMGECIIVETQSDTFNLTLSYLFISIQIIEIFSHLNDATKSQYIAFLRQFNFLRHLLENLFRLMPLNPNNQIERHILADQDKFFSHPVFPVDKQFESSDIQKLSCYVYCLALRKWPAAVRHWWKTLDKKSSEIVNGFTSTYFSGSLCAQELDAVQSGDISKFKNMTVKARFAAREVYAFCKVEEITIELLIQLPPNHPLGPVNIDCGKRVGVSSTQWRNWLLQLTTFLTHQNGSVLDGLALWKRNIDKRFEGVEECMICFYVLHGTTYHLPKLMCRTCKKRYHSACLYKWFSTSNNSTCPLCRNLF